MSYEYFDHDEYHIYTTDDAIRRRYVYLDRRVLDQADRLYRMDRAEQGLSGRWEHIRRREVAEGVYLTVQAHDANEYRPPIRLESRGYQGWERLADGDFEERIFFDTMLFYEADCRFGRWEASDIVGWVDDEHHDEMEAAWEAYRDASDN